MQVITETKSGSRIELARGDTMLVRLKENATTGYRWALEDAGGLLVERSAPMAAGTGTLAGGAPTGTEAGAADSTVAGTVAGTVAATEPGASGGTVAGRIAGRIAGTGAGAAGIGEFRVHALQPGLSQLRLKHWREWQGDSSVIARFTMTVHVP